MFSLIIAIISIVLTAALAPAALYYGGAAFNVGSVAATASRLISEGQQINSAVALYKADLGAGNTSAIVTDLAGLVAAGYLASVPASFAATTPLASHAVTTTISSDVAAEISKRAGASSLFGASTTFHFAF